MTSAELLRLAADALDDGQIPLANPFLSEHDVTFDQCMSLAQQLAIGARIVAAGIENPRSEQGTAMLRTLVEGLDGATRLRCPDKGACHHNCTAGCFRVASCGPLSGVYPDDEWPDSVRAANGGEL